MSSTGRETADSIVTRLAEAADEQFRIDMDVRYGIRTDKALGVRMSTIKAIAKPLGTDHALAADLWATGWYEARIVASLVDDPAEVTPEQMDRWVRDFDNWAIVDSVCFNLFDRVPDAWAMVDRWAASDAEFVKRTAFALIWSLANHDRTSPDERFVERLPLLEAGADDDRHLVSKAVTMALTATAKRRPSLRDAVLAVADRLADSSDRGAAKVGRTVRRELAKRPR